MLCRHAILSFLFALGAAAAFAVSTSDTLSRSEGDYESVATTDALSVNELDKNADLFIKSNSRSSLIAQKRMKSNTIRWFVRGVVGELYHNIFRRQFSRLRGKFRQDDQICRQQPKNEIAIVTGATGGIGSHMAFELATKGYYVIVAARDVTRGRQLVNEINERLAVIPACESNTVASETLPHISFIEYHADNPQSALDLASEVKSLDRKVNILINNAGIMGKSKQLTMKVNLLGPVLLTLALLPLMENSAKDVMVINVGSSAHLRATHVIDEDITLKKGETYVNSLPNTEDRDLSTYSQSKLALMQFSTLLRHTLSKTNSEISIYDAHPGLVWTPLLRNHIGDKATNILHNTGLASLIYKTPLEGARAIVASVDYSSTRGPRKEQIYFENGQPGGFATHESRDHLAAMKLWNEVILPSVKEWVEIPHELV